MGEMTVPHTHCHSQLDWESSAPLQCEPHVSKHKASLSVQEIGHGPSGALLPRAGGWPGGDLGHPMASDLRRTSSGDSNVSRHWFEIFRAFFLGVMPFQGYGLTFQ